MSKALTNDIPRLRRGFRFQWEPVQHCHVLLYPEGMIKLNESASEILKLVDGQRSVGAIVEHLTHLFPGMPGVDEDILTFMEVANAQFWIELG